MANNKSVGYSQVAVTALKKHASKASTKTKSGNRDATTNPTSVKALDLDLRPGQSMELLKELHILTREGKINQDSRRKLKQVHHLYQFIEKLLQDLPATDAGPTLADHGAGKSYLGFILYDLFFKSLGKGEIYGIETRGELVAASQALAQRLGFERMHFLNSSVADSANCQALPERFDVVTALHACDTATDDDHIYRATRAHGTEVGTAARCVQNGEISHGHRYPFNVWVSSTPSASASRIGSTI
jgi:hypothetical protein